MERFELYEQINLPAQIAQKLEGLMTEIDMETCSPYLDQLMDSRMAADAYSQLKAVLKEGTDQLKMLWCQLECAVRVFKRYEEKQIPKQIYTDTMKCFSRFLLECEKKNGRMYFDRGWWTYRQISMSLFRIGTLEYEFKEYNCEPVTALHIPSDADLSKEAVDRSLAQAEQFFRSYYSGYAHRRHTCSSWLLSPALKPLLADTSHILDFQNRFTITEHNKNNKEFISWLFQVPEDTPYADLPAATSLQKKVRNLLLSGGSVGCAFGVL